MCLSKLNQLIYGVIALVAVVLVFASLFTPGWRQITAEIGNGTAGSQVLNETITKGLLPFLCLNAINSNAAGHVTVLDVQFDNLNFCKEWWNNQPTYEKVVIALMAVAALVLLAALVWNVLTFFCCIGSGGIFRPLPSLAGTATICLLVAVLVFYFNNKKDIQIIDSWKGVKAVPDKDDVSYSFYLAIAAMVASFANMVVGSLIVNTAENCL